jgi:hypothetical protein
MSPQTELKHFMPSHKRRNEVKEILDRLGFDPAEALALLAKDERCPLQSKIQCCAELMKYCYPKRSEQFVEIEDNSAEPYVSMIGGIPILEVMANKALSRQIEDVEIKLAAERRRLRLLEAEKPRVIDVESSPE